MLAYNAAYVYNLPKVLTPSPLNSWWPIGSTEGSRTEQDDPDPKGMQTRTETAKHQAAVRLSRDQSFAAVMVCQRPMR